MTIAIDWLDKRLDTISNSELFLKYFIDTPLTEGENVFYLNRNDKGIDIVLSIDLVILTVHLFSGNNNNGKFKESLPFNVKFSMSRSEILEIFGQPKQNGGGHRNLYLGWIPLW